MNYPVRVFGLILLLGSQVSARDNSESFEFNGTSFNLAAPEGCVRFDQTESGLVEPLRKSTQNEILAAYATAGAIERRKFGAEPFFSTYIVEATRDAPASYTAEIFRQFKFQPKEELRSSLASAGNDSQSYWKDYFEKQRLGDLVATKPVLINIFDETDNTVSWTVLRTLKITNEGKTRRLPVVALTSIIFVRSQVLFLLHVVEGDRIEDMQRGKTQIESWREQMIAANQ